MGNTYSDEYWFPTNNAALPKRKDLREAECFPYPSVTDQGYEGSCVVHAMNTAYLCAQRRAFIKVTDSKYPEEEILYKSALRQSQVTRPRHEGITFSEAMKPLQKDTIWFRIGKNLQNFKHCIAAGYPIVVGFGMTKTMRNWHDNIEFIKSTEYVLPLGNANTNESNAYDFHCVLFVGYDDNLHGGVFFARNSWGSSWGNKGHFLFPYKAFEEDIVLDAMVVDIKK